MQEHTQHTPARRRTGGRIAAIVAGGVAVVLAVGLIAGGALALWGDSKTDDQGYLSTGKDRYATSTHALATDNLDIDLDGAGWVMDRDDDLGDVRLAVESSAGKPVFVGIARTSDVTDYLSGSSYTSVTDVDYSPFHASYRDHDNGGDRRPALPADQDFWAASSQGQGKQTVAWDLEDGDWSIVVMNADGSRGVDTDISAGAKVAFLGTLGWALLGGALVLLIIAGTFMYLGLRTPRPPRAQNVTLQTSPGASASA
jgi:predicted ribosomally synthesized peptide with SipW-like signal peptide